jgi:nucleosome binding factor SPN SPT16 subunit
MRKSVMKDPIIHYIGEEWQKIFIVAKTECGKHWQDVEEYTSQSQRVTCKRCLNKLKNKQ